MKWDAASSSQLCQSNFSWHTMQRMNRLRIAHHERLIGRFFIQIATSWRLIMLKDGHKYVFVSCMKFEGLEKMRKKPP